jgi:hypothetical protein
LVFIFGMTTPLLDGYGCAVGLMAITRPSKPTPLGMQTADTAGSRFSGNGAHSHKRRSEIR